MIITIHMVHTALRDCVLFESESLHYIMLCISYSTKVFSYGTGKNFKTSGSYIGSPIGSM